MAIPAPTERTRIRVCLRAQSQLYEVAETVLKKVNLRRTYKALAQLFADHVPSVRPLSTLIYDRECFGLLGCGLNIENRADHFVLRCRRTAAFRQGSSISSGKARSQRRTNGKTQVWARAENARRKANIMHYPNSNISYLHAVFRSVKFTHERSSGSRSQNNSAKSEM